MQRVAEAPPGTLEVNVLRMVGRCLVCSRLISTWVSSLEPPPSTPSPGSLPPPSPPPLLPPSTSALPLALSPPERLVSTTSSGYTSLARRSKFTSVSYVSPRPIMDSSFSSRSRGSEPRATRSLPSPSASLGRHPARALSHFRIPLSLFARRSLALRFVWPCLSHELLSLAKSRDSVSPFPGENVPLPFFVSRVSSSSRVAAAFLLQIRL